MKEDIADQLAQAYADGWRAGRGDSPADKQTKTEVNYEEANDGERRCGTCSNYDDGACDLVSGAIDPEYVCDLFARDPAADSGDSADRGHSHAQSVLEDD